MTVHQTLSVKIKSELMNVFAEMAIKAMEHNAVSIIIKSG